MVFTLHSLSLSLSLDASQIKFSVVALVIVQCAWLTDALYPQKHYNFPMLNTFRMYQNDDLTLSLSISLSLDN